jgi:hypothetical protein
MALRWSLGDLQNRFFQVVLVFPVYNPHFQVVPNDREATLGVTTFYDRQDVYQDEIVKAYLQG